MIGHFLFALLLLPPQSASDNSEHHWTFSQTVSGSANETGTIVKSDTGLGYGIHRFVTLYGGVPFYFVHGDSTTTSTTSSTVSTAGLGNIYGGIRVSGGNAAFGYSSNVTVAAPTGDEDRGFSTGKVTMDWNNTVRGTHDRLSPYVSAGLANTVSGTAFFVRPFASHGTVGHVDGGGTFSSFRALDFGASLYSVRATGDQEIVSRVKKKSSTGVTPAASRGGSKRPFQDNTVTEGTADIVNDKGFSTWLTLRPQSAWSLNVGYNRSATYGLDSVFFGLGFQVTR